MGTLKSQGVTPLRLLETLIKDFYEQAPLASRSQRWEQDARRDIATVRRRYHHEGQAFLTVQLPLLSKWILAVCEGGPPPSLPFSLKGNGFPKLLGGLTVWSSTDEALHDVNFHYVVKCFRQIGQLFYKALIPATPTQIEKAEAKYVAIEDEIRLWDTSDWLSANRGIFLAARALVSRVLGDYSHDRFVHHLPKHGPGAVAERLRGNGKYDALVNQRIASAFPPSRFSVTRGSISERPQTFSSDKVLSSRLILVPKDSRGPRTICAEPAVHQWHQQYLLKCLEEVIPRGTRGRVQFRDQSKNGSLALASSRSKVMATLDMSDASDRIPASLVRFLLPPSWWAVISACRTQQTVLPSGRTLTLRKFASMGSAVCFPIEALVFWSLCVAMTGASHARELTTYVFGDDIIVNSDVAEHLMSLMHKSTTLRFGRDKCFFRGHFRESCGVDAFNGEVVTPLRWKRPLSTSLPGVDLVRFGNEAHKHGWWRVSELCYNSVDAPVLSFSQDNGIISHLGFVPCIPRGMVWCDRLQTYRLKGYVIDASSEVSRFSSIENRLLRALCKQSEPGCVTVACDPERVVFPRDRKSVV